MNLFIKYAERNALYAGTICELSRRSGRLAIISTAANVFPISPTRASAMNRCFHCNAADKTCGSMV
jgi:hypothetical protein